MALRPDQKPPAQPPKSPRPTGSWLRLALLAGLGLYFVILLSPVLSRLGGPARVDLSYSQLVAQIDSGKVADITIQGKRAQGDLKEWVTITGVTRRSRSPATRSPQPSSRRPSPTTSPCPTHPSTRP